MDRKTLSKSAPSIGRRLSKDTVKKQTTMKEINTWIDKGEAKQATAKGGRNVGMLTENVTEQRLLHTRQLELGRERYKFLASHSYEKQKFVEMQNRKSKSMKKMMQNARRVIETTHTKPKTPRRTITVRIPQMGEVNDAPALDSGDTEKVDQTPKVDSRPTQVPILAKSVEQKPPSKGPDERKTVHFPKPVRSGKKPIISGRAVYIDLSNSSFDAHRSQEIVRKTPDTEKSSEKLPSLPNQQNKQVTYTSRNNSAVSRKSGRNSALEKSKQEVASLNRSTETPTKPEAQEELVTKWRLRTRRKIPQFGHKFSSSVGDPRYVALTNTLVPCDDLGKPVVSVADIIAKREILRGESKCEQNSRAKQLHARFIAYLLEQELRN